MKSNCNIAARAGGGAAGSARERARVRRPEDTRVRRRRVHERRQSGRCALSSAGLACDRLSLRPGTHAGFLYSYVSRVIEWMFTYAGVPAIAVPVGMSRTGLPLSVQLIAPPYAEALLLRLARSLEIVTNFPALLDSVHALLMPHMQS